MYDLRVSRELAADTWRSHERVQPLKNLLCRDDERRSMRPKAVQIGSFESYTSLPCKFRLRRNNAAEC
jgi:hypothetical protein